MPKILGAFLRTLWLFLLMCLILEGAEVHRLIWKEGKTFSQYLQDNNISLRFLKTIPEDDAKYLSEIHSGETFFELKEGDRLLQALIPIGEEMQIQIYKDLQSDNYHFDIIPIVYQNVKDIAVVEIHNGCSIDINKQTCHPKLGFLLKHLYKGAVDFRHLREGDRLAVEYRQKSRLGKPWGQTHIKGAVIDTRGNKRFIFVDRDGNAWEDVQKIIQTTITGKRVVKDTIKHIKKFSKKERFGFPVPGARITSRFTYKRWHPILHRYRPHLGVDFGARRGTPIHAVGRGRVIYAGWMRGYGKVVKINHGSGFVSLYAHQSRILVHRGSRVKKGQVIGRVGSTGRSTGPHLHFGLYKRGRAVNPLKYLNRRYLKFKAKTITTHKKRVESYKITKTKKVLIPGAKALKARLLKALKSNPKGYQWEDYPQNFIYINDLPKEGN